MTRPEKSEAADFFFTYIDQVPEGDIRQLLTYQAQSAMVFLESVSEETSLYRYAARKWSMRQVLAHVNDIERVFAYRALWFARAMNDPVASFDENAAMEVAAADDRSWADHVAEFRAVRGATLTLLRGLPDEAWTRGGIAGGRRCTVRALAYMIAGHELHHRRLLGERYLVTSRRE